MSMPSQFALSLELTRLIPAGVTAAGKAWESAMAFARDLRGSGSDLVIEEDLTDLFGRCFVAPSMASAFRHVVGQRQPETVLSGGIMLLNGPGPTVTRALTQASQGSYFAMIVQCSLLVAVHDRQSLSGAITRVFEREAEDAPLEQQKAAPSSEAILGVLRAIEDQTTSFNWRDILLAVAKKLDLQDHDINQTLPSIILQGLITILAYAQRFREERLVVVELNTGVCVLVVWAHHILGLSVVVKMHGDSGSTKTSFGPRPEQVIINVEGHKKRSKKATISQESVTLLTIDGEKIFTLAAEPDDPPLEGTVRGPARGFAKRTLERETKNIPNQQTLVQELPLLTLAFAILWTSKLDLAIQHKSRRLRAGNDSGTDDSCDSNCYHPSKKARRSSRDSDDEVEAVFLPFPTSVSRLLETTKFLFDNTKVTLERTKDYVELYRGLPLGEADIPIGVIAKILQPLKSSDNVWSLLRINVISLSVVIFAFAQATDLEPISELPLHETVATMREESNLLTDVMEWNGENPIQLREEMICQVIAGLMFGESEEIDWLQTSLASTRGWSIYMGSITDSDPIHVLKGSVTIQKGVPFRSNVWKHFILDSPYATEPQMKFQIEATSGNSIELSRSQTIYADKPFCGQRGDCFMFSLRFVESLPGPPASTLIRRAGFGELNSAIWFSFKTKACQHTVSIKVPITLPPGCVALSGFGDDGGLDLIAKVYICMTARSKTARWRALVAIACIADERSRYIPVLLRGQDCCFQCALDQALTSSGMWFLVL